MSLSTWWLFVVATFFISAAPGPNMLLVMNQGARYHFRGAIPAMIGCMSALLPMLTVSAAGLGLVLMNSPKVFDVLRWAGAVYLIYLGYKVWTAPVDSHSADGMNDVDGFGENSTWSTHPSFRARWLTGFLTAASNPKALLFAGAFFPQFMSANTAQLPQILILLATFSVFEILWYCIYATGGTTLAGYLRRPQILKWFNRTTGGAFMGFAVAMALVKKT